MTLNQHVTGSTPKWPSNSGQVQEFVPETQEYQVTGSLLGLNIAGFYSHPEKGERQARPCKAASNQCGDGFCRKLSVLRAVDFTEIR